MKIVVGKVSLTLNIFDIETTIKLILNGSKWNSTKLGDISLFIFADMTHVATNNLLSTSTQAGIKILSLKFPESEPFLGMRVVGKGSWKEREVGKF